KVPTAIGRVNAAAPPAASAIRSAYGPNRCGWRVASLAGVTATAVSTGEMGAGGSARARLGASADTPRTAAAADRSEALRPRRAYRAVAVPTVDAAAASTGTAHHATAPVPGRLNITTAPPKTAASILQAGDVAR